MTITYLLLSLLSASLLALEQSMRTGTRPAWLKVKPLYRSVIILLVGVPSGAVQSLLNAQVPIEQGLLLGAAVALPAIIKLIFQSESTPHIDVKKIGPVVLLLLSCGCATSLESARTEGIAQRRSVGTTAVGTAPSARCTQLDNRRTTWDAVAKGSAMLSGASGISTIPAPTVETKVALASSALVFAALAAIAVSVEENTSTSWVRECSQ